MSNESMMSNGSTRTDFPSGDFISENAVRGVFRRRRRPVHTPVAEDRADGVNDRRAHSPIGGEDRRPPARGVRRLRRWSVAELMARAVVVPPADRLGHR